MLILQDLHDSVNQYFSNDQCMMLFNYARVKDIFKVQDRLQDSNIPEEKTFMNRVSDFTLQIIFKNFLFVQYWYGIKKYHSFLKGLLKLLFPFQSYIRVIFFIYFYQNVSQQIDYRSQYKNKDFLLSQTLKIFAKKQINASLFILFYQKMQFSNKKSIYLYM